MQLTQLVLPIELPHRSQLTIPAVPEAECSAMRELALQVTGAVCYKPHRWMRRRIQTDLGLARADLNQKLMTWSMLDVLAFRAEIWKISKRDIPVKDHDDWEGWLQAAWAGHQQPTAAIIQGETTRGTRVCALFGLMAEESWQIGGSTKYGYGES